MPKLQLFNFGYFTSNFHIIIHVHLKESNNKGRKGYTALRRENIYYATTISWLVVSLVWLECLMSCLFLDINNVDIFISPASLHQPDRHLRIYFHEQMPWISFIWYSNPLVFLFVLKDILISFSIAIGT